MNTKDLHATFLICLASLALLTACGDDADQTASTPATESGVQKKTGLSDSFAFTLNNIQPRPPSWAGSYLSSRIAQERFDWPRAETFLEKTKRLRPDNTLLTRRLMLLAMGSGDFETALAQAKSLKPNDDSSGITHLILVLEPLRDGQIITARSMVDAMPKTSLGNYAAPLLRAWMSAAEGKLDLSELKTDRSHFYHQVLLADFMNQIDLVTDPTQLSAIQDQLSVVSAERMGDIFLRHHKYDPATALYSMTGMIAPNAPDIAAKQKAATDRKEDLTDLDLVQPVANARAGTALVFFDMATSFYNDRGYESAQLFAHMALTLDPDLIEARLLLGSSLSNNNRLDAAIDIYKGIPETSQRYRSVQQQIAALQVAMDQDSAATETLQSLLTHLRDPAEKSDILVQIGDIHRENESFDAALSAYDQAMSLLNNKPGSENWGLLYARGMTLERLKRWDDAEKDLKAALAFQPNHPFLMNYLAYSWADQNIHLDQAMELLLKAVKIAPDDGYITDSVGWVYYRMGKFDEAVKFLERAVELLPYDGTVNDHLGDAYARVGRKREAKFQWHRAVNYSKDEPQKAEIGKKLETGLSVGK